MAALFEQKRNLLEQASRRLTANLGHPAIFGKEPVELQEWPNTGQYTKRTASYLWVSFPCCLVFTPHG